MTRLSSSDLDQLPDPVVIEQLDYEQTLAKIKTQLLGHLPELTEVIGLESEPATQLLEFMAYRILEQRSWGNSLAKSLMLAKAKGPELDHLGALPFIRTPRRIIKPANNSLVPPVPAVKEGDDEYRKRLQIAMEGFSTAGSIGSYIYHALAAHEDIVDVAPASPRFDRWQPPTEVAALLPDNALVLVCTDDIGLTDPLPGDVALTLLSRHHDGVVDDDVVEAVQQDLSADKKRPLTDRVRARSATVKQFEIIANLWFYSGIDRVEAKKAAQEELAKELNRQRRIGGDIPLSAIYAALHRPGVQRVQILQPTADVLVNDREAAYCISTSIIDQGIAE